MTLEELHKLEELSARLKHYGDRLNETAKAYRDPDVSIQLEAVARDIRKEADPILELANKYIRG